MTTDSLPQITDTSPSSGIPAAAPPAPRATARWGVVVARVLLGLLFFVFGLEGFFHFMPQPAPDSIPPGAAALGGAMAASGYLFQLVKGTEVAVGALLLANRFVPLALTILAPVVVNILAFHVFLAPAGIGPGLVALGLGVFLAWSYRDAYRPLLRARHTPS